MVGIIFGSSMGNTEDAAKLISEKLGIENELKNVADIAPADLNKYTALIIGSSTWNDGELQDDWAGFDFSALDVAGKTVAILVWAIAQATATPTATQCASYTITSKKRVQIS